MELHCVTLQDVYPLKDNKGLQTSEQRVIFDWLYYKCFDISYCLTGTNKVVANERPFGWIYYKTVTLRHVKYSVIFYYHMFMLQAYTVGDGFNVTSMTE